MLRIITAVILLSGCAHTKRLPEPKPRTCVALYAPAICIAKGSRTEVAYGRNKCEALNRLDRKLYKAGLKREDFQVKCGEVL